MENKDTLRYVELSKILHQRVLNEKELDEWKKLDKMMKKKEKTKKHNFFTGCGLGFA